MLKKFSARYQRLIDHFVPDAIRADRGASNQARMFLISHTMGPILGNSVPIALCVLDPTPGLDIVMLSASITAFWIFPFLLRAGWNYNALVIASVLNLNFCIFMSCYFYGGVLSPTLPWVLLIPILSFFYIGGNTRLQGALMAIFAGAFALFLVLYYAISLPANDIPEVAVASLGAVSTVAALCYVATMAIYYARIFDAGIELENEVRRRRDTMDKLRSAIVAADEAGLHKAEFLARMSHELRTPLNAVIGYSQILKEEALETDDAQMRNDVERIHDAGQYLMRLINFVLDLSKIESGRMQFKVEDHHIIEILQEAISAARPTMRAAGNTIDLFIETATSEVSTDSQRLLEVVNAVLDNIPVHAPETHIDIHCRGIAVGQNGEGYEIRIRDNGGGISPERLPPLFESLRDHRDAAASKYGGTGLNLTVAHKLALAMGCRLSVESEVGKGTCFTVIVPRNWTPQRPAEQVNAGALAAA